ncbi:Chromosome partition protein Smc [Carpediemonas membranifera]|uniref:Chromosome partition protein Smc n=1 Tax=Carpediemonas membranifera TaxID=201153 RepID=A0A8J6B5K1_9EUKA|nr:Chromosome partition protein Smc [Carpediemonas membranifera]|eukprot:KAG9390477.1 Chromosome partition protein Smc [Carpediemonas membranifera]
MKANAPKHRSECLDALDSLGESIMANYDEYRGKRSGPRSTTSMRLSYATNELVRLQKEHEKRKNREKALEVVVSKRTEETKAAKARATALQRRVSSLEKQLANTKDAAEQELTEIHSKTRRLAKRVETMNGTKEKQTRRIRAIAESAKTAVTSLETTPQSKSVLGAAVRLLEELIDECDVPGRAPPPEDRATVLETALATARRTIADQSVEIGRLRQETEGRDRNVGSFMETLRDQVQSLQSITNAQHTELVAAQNKVKRLEVELEESERGRLDVQQELEDQRRRHEADRRSLNECEQLLSTIREGYREHSRMVADFVHSQSFATAPPLPPEIPGMDRQSSPMQASRAVSEGVQSRSGVLDSTRLPDRLDTINKELDDLKAALSHELGT